VRRNRRVGTFEVPVELGHQHRMGRRASLAQIDPENLLSESGNKWVATIHLLALPAPTEGWEHIERHPDIFKRDLTGERVATRHVPKEDDHGSDV